MPAQIVNDGAPAIWFERFLHELDVERVELIVILQSLVRELQIERHLIRLVDYITWLFTIRPT
jgi:hypothetical protein